MRYLLDKRMEKELNFRRKYIYDIFHVSTKIINHKQFIVLVGIPEDIIDVCFIVGHNNFVQRILQQKKFKEKNLVAITCQARIKIMDFYLPNHNLLIAKLDECDPKGYVNLYDGKEFGFDFDPTESEILLYHSNSSCSIEERLEECFIKVKENGRKIQ